MPYFGRLFRFLFVLPLVAVGFWAGAVSANAAVKTSAKGALAAGGSKITVSGAVKGKLPASSKLRVKFQLLQGNSWKILKVKKLARSKKFSFVFVPAAETRVYRFRVRVMAGRKQLSVSKVIVIKVVVAPPVAPPVPPVVTTTTTATVTTPTTTVTTTPTTPITTPIVPTVDQADDRNSVSAGSVHSCARSNSGQVKCWGQNGYGQLGDGSNNNSNIPVSVSGISDAVSVAAGTVNSCARLASGQVKCWGYGTSGELGDGNSVTSATPVLVSGLANALSVSNGNGYSCAVLSSGQVKCWGRNSMNQLGNSTYVDSSTPVLVTGVSDAVSVSAGSFHACARLASGQVKCWGANGLGQIGDGTIQFASPGALVSGITDAVSVSAGGAHSCARLAAGQIKCWGYNNQGQLGNDSQADSSTPVTVSNIIDAVTVSTGRGGTSSHSCARLASAQVKCWGSGSVGQLANSAGSTSNALTPVLVSGFADSVSVSAGDYHSCARVVTGAVKCWGLGIDGQLGNGYFYSSAPYGPGVPVDVAGLNLN